MLGLTVALALLAACDPEPGTRQEPETMGGSKAAHADSPCDPDNGGIVLPDGFCAAVVADGLGPARHLAVRDNGDIYVRLRRPHRGGGIVALRDADGDGRADRVARFEDSGGTGIAFHQGDLFFSVPTAIRRYQLDAGELVPGKGAENVADGFPEQGQHAAKSFALGGDALFVNVGAPSNACQRRSRSPEVPGLDPCPQLKRQAGIWRFEAGRTGQTQTGDGRRYATGIRNAVALDWNPFAEALFAVQHGRDQLHQLWPDLFSAEQNAELPAEEFFRVAEGDDFGWPYCYYDQRQNRKVLAPEYGGDGRQIGRCERYQDPVLAFPGHWAPNDLLFYRGEQFPARYRGGAFIAFHGSWNRAPFPQQGYKVVFAPFAGDRPTGETEVFADGFAGQEPLRQPGEARFRPMGLAQGADGSLYIGDSQQGRIWRVRYVGGK